MSAGALMPAGRQNGWAGRSSAVPVIKLLSGTAKTCACPGCATPLVFAGEAGG